MIKSILLLLLFAASFVSNSQNADDALGTWLTGNGNAHVKIIKAGEFYFGNIVWLKNPNDEDGKPKTDKENPNVAKRSRKIWGLMMLTGFKFDAGSKTWTNGEIYDPKNGKTYSCKMSLKDKTHLDVRGYMGISLIGRTDEWTRVE